jgi:hypothetical protein
MVPTSKVFRVAALLLLLSAAFCFGADLSQGPCLDDGPATSDCFCCCTHVIPSSHTTWMPEERFTFMPPVEREFLVFVPPARLFRPPRA